MSTKKLKIKNSKRKSNKKTTKLTKSLLTDSFELEHFIIDEEVHNKLISSQKNNKKVNELEKLLSSETYSHFYPIYKKEDNKVEPGKQKKVFKDELKYHQGWKRGLTSPHLLNLKEQEIHREPKGDFIREEEPKKKFFKISKINFHFPKQNLIRKLKKDKKNYWPELNINFRLKFAVNFLLICLLLLTPIYGLSFFANLDLIKDKVYIQSAQAITDLENAARSTIDNDYNQAILNFNQAAMNFSEAKEILDSYNNLFWKIANYLPYTDKQINSAKNILMAGQKISQAASDLTYLINSFKLNNENSLTLTENINGLIDNINKITEQLNSVYLSLNDLDNSIIPPTYKNEFQYFQNQLPALLLNLQTIKENLNVVYKILAPNEKRQYLIFFQNSNEIRATGGFLGSFALITIKNGEIIEMEIPGGGPYDLKGSLTKKVISPKPMHLIGTRWQIWDANWWPDFPTSARKILWFYEASGGATVDGIILINSNIMPGLLELSGNIYLEKYDKLITPENIIPTLQYAVEYEYDKEENKPKQIIADLTPVLLDKLLNIENEKMSNLLNILLSALKEKDIQTYFTDGMLQKEVINLDWGGSVKYIQGDYLMVINQNIGGGKTDQVINQTINLKSEIFEDGTIENTLLITRNNNGNPEDIFEKINNISYIRIYVPPGSELLDIQGYLPPPATSYKNIESDYQVDEYLSIISGQVYQDENTGTEIYNEFGKTVFGNWLQVMPGQEKTLSLKYRLPFKLKQSDYQEGFILKIINYFQPQKQELENYSLLIQKQSGSHNILLNTLQLPQNKKIIWASGSNNQSLDIQQNNSLNFYLPLNKDQSYAVLIE